MGFFASLRMTDVRGLLDDLREPLGEFHCCALGPAAVVLSAAVAFPEKGAVPAVAGLDESQVGIGGDPLAGLGAEPDKRIVRGVNDQTRHGDAIDHIGGGGAGVVVIGAGKPAIERGDPVIKFAQAGNSLQARGIEIRAGNNLALRRKRWNNCSIK